MDNHLYQKAKITHDQIVGIAGMSVFFRSAEQQGCSYGDPHLERTHLTPEWQLGMLQHLSALLFPQQTELYM